MATRIVDLNGSRGVRRHSDGWTFRGIDRYGTMPSGVRRATRWMRAAVPGTVHTDLMAAGVIPDPFVSMNENLVQWVDGQQWIYRRRFVLPDDVLREDHLDLVAEGLDTFAEVRINRKLVAVTANMFIAHRFDIRRHVRRGWNTLEILFDSPAHRSKALEQAHGALRVALEPPRVYARKAQYSFSWDWGPKLTTSGIWKDISIEAYSGPRLRHLFARVVAVAAHRAVVEISADIEHPPRRPMTAAVSVDGHDVSVSKETRVKGNTVTARLEVPHPRLWWPNGYGDQPLYHARVVLRENGTERDAASVTFAIRTVKLLQERDNEGRSFILMVNGVKVFCKGADWIPCDTFLPRITGETYERLLGDAKDAHMNMIRVWGGGIYEQDLFYDLCDTLGLLVWQDFMFACGEYPEQRWFLDQIRDEAAAVVRRLRNHPSIAVWCGNNESEWLFCTENPGASPDAMSGARIFRELLPAVCATHDGTRPYWRSSPFGSGFPNGESDGNHHQWLVWSAWQDYPAYEKDTARFVTEFGFQAPANRRTFEGVLRPSECLPQSPAFEHHNKQVEGPERLIRFQAAHHQVATEFDEFIYKCQLVQAEALKCAVEHWRRRKFQTAGALFWQLNDCWPVSSWAVIDSALRPKAAYFFAKRLFAPILVSFKRAGVAVEVHLSNDLLTPVVGTLQVALRSFGGHKGWSKTLRCRVPANATKRLFVIRPEVLGGLDTESHYLLARVLVDGAAVTENRFFFDEPKRLRLPVPHVSATIRAVRTGVFRLSLRAGRAVKYLRMEIEGEDAVFEDNYFDLDAGGTKDVLVRSSSSIGKIRSKLRLHSLSHAGRVQRG